MDAKPFIGAITPVLWGTKRSRSAWAKSLLSVIFILPALAQALDYTYTVTNGTVTITGYVGRDGLVTIPSALYGLPVTGIGYEAFRYESSLTNVTIPSSVTSIGGLAFANCSNL